jgi:hypothetical protein
MVLMKNDNQLILASKRVNGDFRADELISDLDDTYAKLEYGDVANGEVQVWEYPSRKVFKLEPDRKVEEKQFYSPQGNRI